MANCIHNSWQRSIPSKLIEVCIQNEYIGHAVENQKRTEELIKDAMQQYKSENEELHSCVIVTFQTFSSIIKLMQLLLEIKNAVVN